MNCAPIFVCVYDRLEHFKRCIASLQANPLASESVLYIASDAPYKAEHQAAIQQVRNYAKTIAGFKEVRLRCNEKNLGAHLSGLKIIAEILNEYDSMICLEDDIVVSPDFLQYLNDGLNYYKDDKHCFSICGFKTPFKLPANYDKDVYFYFSHSPWGMAIWKDRWESVDHSSYDRYSELRKNKTRYKKFLSIGFYIKGILQADSKGEIEASDLRLYYYMFQHNMYSVFPVISKAQNWGFDGSGAHCGNNKKAWWTKPELDLRNKPTNFIPFTGFDKVLLNNHRKFQDKINGGVIAKYLKYTWVHTLYKRLKKVLKGK
ncbi:hypothetical protein AGMMS4957_05440 [Bacteroidia bacterium]|nr:hypothetical protein AGMMS4957_05440 [Bacteroidia bacterium]